MSNKTKSKPTKDVSIPAPAYTAYAVSWTESEAGWGCRGDGWSIHKDEAEVSKYQQEYWARQPKETPHEYSRPDSEKCQLIKVSEALYKQVHKNGSVRIWENNPNFETYEFKK